MSDSREQLQADINSYLSQAGTDPVVSGWLDRQDAITRAECNEEMKLQHDAVQDRWHR